MENPTQEGRIPFNIPSLDTPCFTSFKVFGDLQAGPPPLVILHGGPGSAHEYLLPFAELWRRYGIPLVFYDQIGCGASTHLRHTIGDYSFWQLDVFIAELENLIQHFRLDDSSGPGFDLLGHSFGGFIAVNFAAKQPRGLRRLALAGTPASLSLGFESIERLKQRLPPAMSRAIDEAVKTRDFQDPAYLKALSMYERMFICRAPDPYPPPGLVMRYKHQKDDPTVRQSLIGPSPWAPSGSLVGLDCIPMLHRINVPTLVCNGEYDTAQDETVVPFFEHIPRVRWISLPSASHMAHLDSVEMCDRVLKLMGDFFRLAKAPAN